MDKCYLKDIALHISDGEHGTVHDSPSNFLLLSNKNIVDGRIMISSQERTISEEDFKRINKRAKVQKNSILISTVGEIGKTAFVHNDDINFTFQRSVGIVNVNESKANPYFVYLYLQLPYVQKYMDAKSKGSVQKCLFINDMCNLEIYLPDLSTQDKISSVIGNIDKKIYLNAQINAELESLAKTIYDYWFLQFDFPNKEGKPYKSSGGAMVWNKDLKMEIPEGWEVLNACDVAMIDTGNEDANHSTPNGKYPFFTCSNDILKCDDYAFDGKTVLIAGNGNFNVKSYEGKFNAYQRTYVVIPHDSSLYGVLYFSALYSIERFKKGSNGSIVKYITKSDVDNIKVINPHNDVDVEILNNILSLIQHNQKENEELVSLRDFFLPLLMNGQVGFKDA